MSIDLSQLTSYLRSLSKRRNNGIVTADDVQKYLNRKNFTDDRDSRLSVIRSVLNSSNFNKIGTVTSTRDEAKSRRIAAWTVSA